MLNVYRTSIVITIGALALAVAVSASADDKFTASVEQLRHAAGRWSVVTEFLKDDGTVARSVTGTYVFEWVVEDRVLRGQSEIPELKQRSAILFYVNEKRSSSSR